MAEGAPTWKLAKAAQVAKALAHPTRLRILEELGHHQERCVCELTRLVGADISTVSRHLAVLRVAGLLVDEKRGQQVFYRLRNPDIIRLVEAIEEVVTAATREQLERLALAG